MPVLDDVAWRLLFLDARTHNAWLERPVDDALLCRLYELVRMGPTGGNSQPLRLVFVKTPQAKERLRFALDPGNVAKTMTAPVTAILAYDTQFYEKLGRLAPHLPGMGERIASLAPQEREHRAVQSATLQGGYLILAARGLGLDCGPMGGFDRARVDAEFFPEGTWKSMLLINLGYGEGSKLHPRAPRLGFEESCKIV